jgi:hypothetical protein
MTSCQKLPGGAVLVDRSPFGRSENTIQRPLAEKLHGAHRRCLLRGFVRLFFEILHDPAVPLEIMTLPFPRSGKVRPTVSAFGGKIDNRMRMAI